MNAASPGESLRLALRTARSVLLTGPMFPDGDSVGACLALARAIRCLSDARVDVAGDIPFRYAWMPGANDIIADEDVRWITTKEVLNLILVVAVVGFMVFYLSYPSVK